MTPLVLQDSTGLLWTISVNAWGQIVATGGATGIAVGVYINDSSGASYLLSFNPTVRNIQTSRVSVARNFPTSIAIDDSWLIGVDTSGLVVISPSSQLALWQQTVISQYANSPTLLALIEDFNSAVDPSGDIDNFYSWIWNIDTAQGFGLDIWGRIVGVGRAIQTSPPTILTDSQFRSLILLKALSNISIATSPAINSLLRNWMAGRGKAYVNDLGEMEIRYSFEFDLEPFEILIITESGIFLRPAGVGGWAVATTYPVFGFKEMGTTWAAPFDQEPFMPAGNPYAVS
jgi:hypothetical protein